MANEKNLRPFNTMTAKQRKEISQKGGRASGAARRAKRERINQVKAEMWAEREMRSDEITMLCKSIKELRQLQLLGLHNQ